MTNTAILEPELVEAADSAVADLGAAAPPDWGIWHHCYLATSGGDAVAAERYADMRSGRGGDRGYRLAVARVADSAVLGVSPPPREWRQAYLDAASESARQRSIECAKQAEDYCAARLAWRDGTAYGYEPLLPDVSPPLTAAADAHVARAGHPRPPRVEQWAKAYLTVGGGDTDAARYANLRGGQRRARDGHVAQVAIAADNLLRDLTCAGEEDLVWAYLAAAAARQASTVIAEASSYRAARVAWRTGATTDQRPHPYRAPREFVTP